MLKRDVNLERLLDVNEAAAALGKRVKTIRQMVWRRELEYLKIGRSIRFRPSTIAALVDQAVIPPRNARSSAR